MSDYFVLGTVLDENSCSVYDFPENMPDIDYPAVGISAAETYPDGLEFRMSNDVPGIQVPDVINNALGYLMGTAKLRQVLEQHASADIEFLRFTLINHKGRQASDECYIANIIGTMDCVDTARTVGDSDPVNPGRLMFIEQLYLLEQQINPKVNIFRIASRPRIIVVRDDLKRQLEAHAITGVVFIPMGAELNL